MFYCLRLLLAALIANQLTPNFPNDNSGREIYCSLYQQAVTDRIRGFNNRTFPCVSVDSSNMLINYQTFANFVDIFCMFTKAKTLSFFYPKKSKLFKIFFKKPSVYPKKVLSSCNIDLL